MSLNTSIVWPQAMSAICAVKSTPSTSSLSFYHLPIPFHNLNSKSFSYSKPSHPFSRTCNRFLQSRCFSAGNSESNTAPDDRPSLESQDKPQRRGSSQKKVVPQNEAEDAGETFPTTKPKKPRRGRRSEAAAVEEFVRDSLDRTFASMREQNPDICIEKEQFFKERMSKDNYSDISDDEEDTVDLDAEGSGQMVVEEESTTWPLDADVGWGIRASEYFEKHAIKNVIGDDGTEIDWEGEIDDNWVQEINCLEWESFAFHPSPLIVLVFERFRRPSDNWKLLKELEKALLVYWQAKDRLPPRAVKLDINIERDLAYALQVREGPEILFLRGHKILYREKEFRSADDLVRMIAFFYYNAKKPSWIDEELLAR